MDSGLNSPIIDIGPRSIPTPIGATDSPIPTSARGLAGLPTYFYHIALFMSSHISLSLCYYISMETQHQQKRGTNTWMFYNLARMDYSEESSAESSSSVWITNRIAGDGVLTLILEVAHP